MHKFNSLSLLHRSKWAVLLISAALPALLVGGCGSSQPPEKSQSAAPAGQGLEKPNLKLGFIKLTDMAPLAIAKEKGFFAEEGLNVTLEPQANWKVLLDGVIGGQLDGAHMLAGQPLAAAIGLGTKADLIVPISLDLNGNAITVSNAVWAKLEPGLAKGTDGKPLHPIKADALKPVVVALKAQGKPLKMGMVFPVSPHNYELRYWLAAGGLNPGYYLPGDVAGATGADVLLSVTPPPQMPATLEAGTIDGYSVGEPWNQAAVVKKIGVPVITDHDIFPYNPEKVFGLTARFAEANPKTVQALVRAIIKAQIWLDANNGANRAEAVKILARSHYVGADEKVIAQSMTGSFTFGAGDTRPAPDFNIFFGHNAGYPFYSDAVWTLTQMRRWGQIAESKPDEWYAQIAKQVYRPDLYAIAAKALIEAGKAPAEALPQTDGYRPPQDGFIDGKVFEGKTPNAYLDGFEIGLHSGQAVTPTGVK